MNMNSPRMQCRLLSELDPSQYDEQLLTFRSLNFQEQLSSIHIRFYQCMDNFKTTGLIWEGYDEYKFCVCQLQLIDNNLREDQFEELTELIIEMNSNQILQEILDQVYDQKQNQKVQSLKHIKINNRDNQLKQQMKTIQQKSQLQFQSQYSVQSSQSQFRQLQNSVFRESKIEQQFIGMSIQSIHSNRQSIGNRFLLETQKSNNLSSKLLKEAQIYRVDSYLDQAHKILENIILEDLSQEEVKIYLEIEDSYNFMIKNITELESDGWTLDKSTNGISVYYKFPKNTSTVSLKMEATIDCDILKLMALISEVALFPKYVPFCNHAQMLKQISRTQKLCQSQLHFPIISDRETTFLGEGIDRLKLNGTVLFLCKSVDQQYLDEQNVQINKQRFVSLDVNYYIFQITPINKNRCKIEAVNNSDPKMPYLPKWVAGFIARKFTFNLVEKIVKYTQNFEQSPWAKHLDNEFYTWLREKIQNYWDNV